VRGFEDEIEVLDEIAKAFCKYRNKSAKKMWFVLF